MLNLCLFHIPIRWGVVLSAFLLGSVYASDMVSLKEGAPSKYVVKKGDTLWDISEHFLDDPWLWPKVWQVNPAIENPHLIYPGDIIWLSWRDGQPVLSLKPVKKVSPHLRVESRQPISTFSDSLVLPYLKSDRLLVESDSQQGLVVLGTSEGRQFLTYEDDRVYVDGIAKEVNWSVYRVMESYERDDTVQAQVSTLRLVAEAQIAEVGETFSALKVVKQYQEILPNDVVLPNSLVADYQLDTKFTISAAEKTMTATILGTVEQQKFMVKNQVVILDKGQSDGILQGTTFDVMASGSDIYGAKGEYRYQKKIGINGSKVAKLPSVAIGEVVVIRPYQYFSLALITSSQEPISANMTVISPWLNQEE